MASIPEIIASAARPVLQPLVLGLVVLGMGVARELYPRWPSSLRRVIYDLLLVGLSGLLFVIVAMRVVSG